jgi:acetyl-CoA carboxylase biotin carboxyl carrier protein
MKFDIENLQTLVKSMEENNISELAFEDKEMKIKLKRGYETATVREVQYTSSAMENMVVAHQNVDTEDKGEDLSNLHSIDSPMVGIFYSKPSPEASVFVQEGDSVSEGQVLCIVEAMKMMNEIKSDKSGKIVKVLFDDGDAVKKGDKLFLID